MTCGYADCRAYLPDGSYTYGLSENIFKFPRVTAMDRNLSELVKLGDGAEKSTSTGLLDIFDEDSKAMAYGC